MLSIWPSTFLKKSAPTVNDKPCSKNKEKNPALLLIRILSQSFNEDHFDWVVYQTALSEAVYGHSRFTWLYKHSTILNEFPYKVNKTNSWTYLANVFIFLNAVWYLSIIAFQETERYRVLFVLLSKEADRVFWKFIHLLSSAPRLPYLLAINDWFVDLINKRNATRNALPFKTLKSYLYVIFTSWINCHTQTHPWACFSLQRHHIVLNYNIY